MRKDSLSNILVFQETAKWFLVGIYQEAEYVSKSPLTKFVLDRKVNDLLVLGNSIGKKYNNKNEIIKEIKNSVKWLHWKVKPSNIIRTAVPIEIPKIIFNTENYRIVKPTSLTEKEYKSIYSLLEKQYDISIVPDISVEFPEGRIIEIQHKTRERNPTIVRLAKENYKKKNKLLECQVCGFSFEKIYGAIGIDFIEAHHTLPISRMNSKSKTKVEDIALVCSNCHKMLHRKRPWITLKELHKLLK